jgi:hypothetical protein
MAHLGRAPVRDSRQLQLVVTPASAVRKHAVDLFHQGEHSRLRSAQRWRIKKAFPALSVLEQDAYRIADMGIMPMGGVGRGLAVQRHRDKAHARQVGYRKFAVSVDFDSMALHAAIMSEHIQDRKPSGQVLIDHVRAVDVERFSLAQKEQSGCVVNLAIDQHYPGDRRVSDGSPRLKGRESLYLGADIGRSVNNNPSLAVIANGHRRLGARLRLD